MVRQRSERSVLVISDSITNAPIGYDRHAHTTTITTMTTETSSVPSSTSTILITDQTFVTTTTILDDFNKMSNKNSSSVLNTTSTFDSGGGGGDGTDTSRIVYYDQVLLTADNWITISLSAVSIVALIVFTVLYILAKMKNKPKAQKKKRILIKKLFKKEHLIFSYCVTLLISHTMSITHIIVSQRLFESSKTEENNRSSISEYKSPGETNVTKSNLILLPPTADSNSSPSSSSSSSSGTGGPESASSSSARTLCLVIGILRQYFWLATVLHTNAISFTMYFKLDKTLNENLIDRKQRLRSAIETYSYVYGTGLALLILSIVIQFSSAEHAVYNLNMSEKLFCCFLNKPVYLTLFFALPIALILVVNFTLFVIVLYRTKPTLDQQQSEVATAGGGGVPPQPQPPPHSKADPVEYKNEAVASGAGLTPVTPTSSNFFVKLAIIMGLSWVVYIMTIIVVEASVNVSIIQYSLIISSLQVNLQGVIVAVGLFFNVVYDKFVRGEKSDAKAGGQAAVAAAAIVKQNMNVRHQHIDLNHLNNKKVAAH